MASTDDHETLEKFARKNEVKFPILSDPDGIVAKKYGVLNFGKFASRSTFIIDINGRVLHVDPNVNPITAGSDLVKTLGKLMGKEGE